MCTVVILRRPEDPWPLMMAANRDEMETRPWRRPARHWPDRDNVVAGLDELGGGSWLGLNDDGVVAAVMNRPHSLGPGPGFRSRGELPLEALDHATAEDAADALSHLDPAAYRPFNMVIADATDAFWLRAAGNEADAGGGAQRVEVLTIPPGLSMMTSLDLNDLSSPRIARYLAPFQKAVPPNPDAGDWKEWASLMAARAFDPGAGPSGAMTIVTETGFGTVSSSMIALPSRRRFGTKPIFLFTAGRPGENPYESVVL